MLKRKLHVFFGVVFFQSEAPHFCFVIVKKYDVFLNFPACLNTKLQGNCKISHDLILHRKIQRFRQTHNICVCVLVLGWMPAAFLTFYANKSPTEAWELRALKKSKNC